MKKILFTLAALTFASTASAQAGGKPFLGVGAQVGTGTTAITVPLNVTPVLRIEPFLGYSQNRTTDSTSPVGKDLDWNSTLRLGAGAFYVMDVGNQVELLAGGRLTIRREAAGFKYKSSGTTLSGDDSFIGFGLSAVGGAEYYFSPRFALGVEAELGFETIEAPTDIRNTDIFTASYVTAKVFFK
jgi:hypothetical protein